MCLVPLLLTALAAAAPRGAEARAANAIERIDVTMVDDAVVVSLALRRPPTFTTRFAGAEFVVDLPETTVDRVPSRIPVEGGPVTAVESRAVRREGVGLARVSLALSRRTEPPEVRAVGAALQIRIVKVADRGAPTTAAEVAVAGPRAAPTRAAPPAVPVAVPLPPEAAAPPPTADVPPVAAAEPVAVPEAVSPPPAAPPPVAAVAPVAPIQPAETPKPEAVAAPVPAPPPAPAPPPVLAVAPPPPSLPPPPPLRTESSVASARTRRAPRTTLLVREVRFRSMPTSATVLVRLSGSPRFRVAETGERRVAIELPGTTVARKNDARALDTSFFPGPVVAVTPRRAGTSTWIEITLKEDAPHRERVEGDTLAIEFDHAADR